MTHRQLYTSISVLRFAGALALLGVLRGPVVGIPISIKFTAEVAEVEGKEIEELPDLLGTAVRLGQTISGVYTYDSCALDSDDSLLRGEYRHRGPPYGITVRFGALEFRPDPEEVVFQLRVVNDQGGGRYSVRSQNYLPLATGATVREISWYLHDPCGTALSSTELPRAVDYGVDRRGRRGQPGYADI